jgi:imidazolonepropionase-like amidohydrolase
MAVMRRSALLLASLILSLAIVHAQGNDPGAPDVWAIVGARIVPVGSPVIEKGTLVLRDGRIEALGAEVKAPADAKVLDGANLTLYPALIDASTKIGMPAEPPAPSYPIGTIRAENQAAALFKPDPAAAKSWRAAGFGAALTALPSGLFSGSGTLVSLADGDAPSLILRQSTSMHLDLFRFDGAGGYPGSLMGRIAAARQALTDASYFAARLAAYDENPLGKERPQVHRALQALYPVTTRLTPLIAKASSGNEISRALRFSKEFGLTPLIDGGAESWAQTEALKKAEASVLLSAALPESPKREPGEPSRESLSSLRRRALAPTSAAALAKAGVPFALTTSGLSGPGELGKNVRKMLAAGLTEEQAVAALTLTPARLLGVERQLGTLAPGKLGYVLAVEGGTLFAPKSKLRMLFLDGKKFELSAASSASGGTKPSVLPQLPPGISKEQALAFLKANPDQAAAFLPPGVSVAQAIAELEGKGQATEAPKPGEKPAEDEKVAPPPAVTPGPLFPVPPSVGDAFVLRGGTLWTGDAKPFVGDLYVKGGKIAGVGPRLSVPAGTKEIDARGKHIAPGIIDCHSHSAVEGSVNEGSNIVTAEVRIADVLDATDISIYRQLAGGVTAANVLHGSANAIGGQNAVVKWRWGVSEPTDLLYAPAPQGIKFALGENPTGSNSGGRRTTPRYPLSRLGVERVIRSKFLEAIEYRKKRKAGGPVRQDFQLDAIAEILDGRRLVHCHSYRADEILMMVRLAEEFGFKVATFQHVLEGYKVADELASHGAGGSTFSDWWAYKIEAYDAIPHNATVMTRRGVVSSINSDDDEMARRLSHEAAKSLRYGLSEVEALALVTINPARQLGIDQFTGSLTVGKDADLAIWSGSPLSSQSICEQTFVEGVLRFDLKADKAARAAVAAEKERLVTALDPKKPDEKKPELAVPAPEKWAGATPASAASSPRQKTEMVALVGGTVHTVSGGVIEKGVLVMHNGLIVSVGDAGRTKVPAGAKTLRCEGKHLWPGLIDMNTSLGLSEIGSRRETRDDSELGEFAPELRASVAVNPDAETIRVARTDGVLSVLTAPTGGTISGQGAFLDLDGWTVEDMGGTNAAGLWINWPSLSSGGRRFGESESDYAHRCEEDMRAGRFVQGPTPPASQPDRSVEEALRPLNEFWEQARRYTIARSANPKTPTDPKFAAMLPYLAGTKPLFIRASAEKQIRTAVLWAKKAGLKIVIVGGREADRCADLLAKEKVPVILGKVCSLPGDEDAAYDDAYTLPSRLAKAGVKFCFSTGTSADVRHLPFQGAMAAAFGLSRDDAVKAMTLWPGSILGGGLGALEAGKRANVLVTDGDILEQRTRVLSAYVQGRPVDLTNKQTRQFERWSARPKK